MRYLFSTAALAGALACAVSAAAGARQVTTVGTSRPGETTLEFVARVDQVGPRFTFYGYVTHVRGLPDGALFSRSGGERSEESARITFFGTTTLTSRSDVDEKVYAVASSGAITFHLSPGGASFAHPESFSRGRAIATQLGRLQNVITVQYAPGQDPETATQAVSVAVGDMTERSASAFALGGRQYRLGRKGLAQRVFATGDGTLVDPTPRAVMLLAGNATTAGA